MIALGIEDLLQAIPESAKLRIELERLKHPPGSPPGWTATVDCNGILAAHDAGSPERAIELALAGFGREVFKRGLIARRKTAQ